VEKCKADPSKLGCFPLVWTTSPQLMHLAPDMLEWFYNQNKLTKNDYVVLPPSGDTYSYPGLMRDADQASFVQKTERDCELMGTSGVVAWEFFGTWRHAVKDYFPRYSERGVVRGLFGLNVPFFAPTGEFLPGEFHRKMGEKTILFRPRTWRGTKQDKSIPKAVSAKDYLSPQDMAAEINNYPKGTASYIYLTSDGGCSIDCFYDLVPKLAEHVEVVSHEVLIDMAMQKEELKASGSIYV